MKAELLFFSNVPRANEEAAVVKKLELNKKRHDDRVATIQKPKSKLN